MKETNINDINFWSLFSHDRYDIMYPKDWDRVQPQLPIISFQAETTSDSDYFATVNVIIEKRNDNLEDEVLIDSIKPTLEKLIYGLDNYEKERITNERVIYYKISYTSQPEEGLTLIHNQYVWLLAGYSYSLTFIYLPETFEMFEPVKNVMFSAFTLK